MPRPTSDGFAFANLSLDTFIYLDECVDGSINLVVVEISLRRDILLLLFLLLYRPLCTNDSGFTKVWKGGGG